MPVDADQLKTWMDARIADGALSVVVFCKDIVPDTVAEENSASCTLRQYLDAGGKVVWYSEMPMYYQGFSDGSQTKWAEAGMANILDIPGTSWANDTATMGTASAGRSNYLSEESLTGTPDPGAVAVSIVFEALAASIQQ